MYTQGSILSHANRISSLTYVEYYILAVLLHGPCHGLGIMETVARWTDNTLMLIPGTLYNALRRMFEANLIEFADDEGDTSRRKNYKLTEDGYRELEHFKRWAMAEALRHIQLFPELQCEPWALVSAQSCAESENQPTPDMYLPEPANQPTHTSEASSGAIPRRFSMATQPSTTQFRYNRLQRRRENR